MITEIVTHRDHNFQIEAHGMRPTEGEELDDFEKGLEAANTIIADMTDDEFARFLMDVLMWQSGDRTSERPASLSRLQKAAWEATTEGWHKPDQVQISISLVK